MKKKFLSNVAIIGNHSPTLELAKDLGITIVEQKPEFIINGIGYVRIYQKPHSANLLNLLIIGEMFGGVKTKPNFSLDNCISEFKLIQEKKSKLSRSQRDAIVNQFNRNFKPLEK